MKNKIKEISKDEKRKALVYCRVSSVRQSVEGSGLESQEQRCLSYASQNGYEIDRTFKDSFTGGGDFMLRPAMAAMIAYIDSKPYLQFIVIFDDLKRLARDTEYYIKLRAAFKMRGVEIYCLNYHFEDTPEGRFTETIFAAQGALEREQNKRQVIQKQEARLARGYWPFFPPPGYRSEKFPEHGKLLVPVKPEAEIIAEALEGYASDRFRIQSDVQGFLILKGFKGSGLVYLERVKRLLSRAVLYAGYIEYPRWEVKLRRGHHQALISLETAEIIKQKLLGTVHAPTRKDLHADFPLRGFVLCAKCDEPMTASWSSGKKQKHAYYRCRNGKCEERTKSIQRDRLHKPVEEALQKLSPVSAVLEYAKSLLWSVWGNFKGDIDGAETRKEKELKELDHRLEGLVTKAGEATAPAVVKAYEAEIEKLSEKRIALLQNLNKTRTEKPDFGTAVDVVYDFLKDPYEQWVNGDIHQKRLVLKLVFSGSLVYDRENGFGTAEVALPSKVFSLFGVPKSQDVEKPGIEPGCT